jgi:hypothetical protein
MWLVNGFMRRLRACGSASTNLLAKHQEARRSRQKRNSASQPPSEVELQIIQVDQGCAVAALLVRCYAPRNSLFGCKFSLLRRLGNFVLKQLYFLPKAVHLGHLEPEVGKFPCIFPYNREPRAETGSLMTASSANIRWFSNCLFKPWFFSVLDRLRGVR